MTYPPQQPGPYQHPGGYGPPQQWQQPPGWYSNGGFTPPPSKRRTGLVIGIVIAVVVVLGGGTGAFFLFSHGGSDTALPTPAATSAPKPSANETALGNLSTLDPCSLVDTRDFDGTVDALPYSFTGCLVLVNQEQAQLTTDLTVEFADTWDLSKVDHSKYSVRKQGAATVVAPTDRSSTSACYDDVFFTDTNTVLVNAKPDSGNVGGGTAEDNATLCREADNASKSVVAAINNHSATHLTYNSLSMGSYDACFALNEQTVRETIGGPGTSHSYPGSHSCFWGDWNSQDQPDVMFGTDLYTDPQTPGDVQGETAQMITAHPTLIVPEGADSSGTLFTCHADTPEHTWPTWPGKMTPTDSGSSQIIEYASMRVTAKGSQDTACQDATKLAALTWPQLPKAV
jgi:hypothetical protein